MQVMTHLDHCAMQKRVVCCKQIVVVMVVFFFLMGNIAGKLIALISTVFFSHA